MDMSWYMDWCPRSTNSVHLETKGQAIVCDEINAELSKSLLSPIAGIECTVRNDGIFIFGIKWFEKPEDISNRVFNAHIASHKIKASLNHTHMFNKKIRDFDHAQPFASITINPIEIDDKCPLSGKLAKEKLGNDKFLLELLAASWNPDETSARPAMLALRLQYSRIFEKALQARNSIRNRPSFTANSVFYKIKWLRKWRLYSVKKWIAAYTLSVALLSIPDVNYEYKQVEESNLVSWITPEVATYTQEFISRDLCITHRERYF